jgi:DNA-binding CsgD family transcriptional regulator
MEKVSTWLTTQPEPVSRQTIKDAKLGKAEYVTAAIDALLLEDYAVQTEGPRGAKLVAGTRPFKDDTRPIPDPFPPIPGTGERTHSHPFPPLQGEPVDLRGARNGSTHPTHSRPRRTRRRHPVLMTHDHDTAKTVCTPGELIVYQLTERGLSQRTISLHLNISRSTVRSRLENAYRKIRNAKGEAA